MKYGGFLALTDFYCEILPRFMASKPLLAQEAMLIKNYRNLIVEYGFENILCKIRIYDIRTQRWRELFYLMTRVLSSIQFIAGWLSNLHSLLALLLFLYFNNTFLQIKLVQLFMIAWHSGAMHRMHVHWNIEYNAQTLNQGKEMKQARATNNLNRIGCLVTEHNIIQ